MKVELELELAGSSGGVERKHLRRSGRLVLKQVVPGVLQVRRKWEERNRGSKVHIGL